MSATFLLPMISRNELSITLYTLWHNAEQNLNQKTLRHGIQCVIQYPTNRNPTQSLQENAITVFGPLLYNSLPKYLRDIESVKTENFKIEFDKFLELIPDEPKIPNYVTASGSNSILDQLTHLRAQEIYWSGGVPDRPWSSLSSFETTPSIQVHWLSVLMDCARAVSLKYQHHNVPNTMQS